VVRRVALTGPLVLVVEVAAQLFLEAAEVVRFVVVKVEAPVDGVEPAVVVVEACRETSEAAVQSIGHHPPMTQQPDAVE
jgi:hypothetical protein